MAATKIVGHVVTAAAIGLAVSMVVSNPDPLTYQTYATDALIRYGQQEICDEAPPLLRLLGNCELLIESLRPTLEGLVASNTQRRNFLFFSLYRTSVTPIALTSLLPTDAFPAYRTDTLAILNRFHIYRAVQESSPAATLPQSGSLVASQH